MAPVPLDLVLAQSELSLHVDIDHLKTRASRLDAALSTCQDGLSFAAMSKDLSEVQSDLLRKALEVRAVQAQRRALAERAPDPVTPAEGRADLAASLQGALALARGEADREMAIRALHETVSERRQPAAMTPMMRIADLLARALKAMPLAFEAEALPAALADVADERRRQAEGQGSHAPSDGESLLLAEDESLALAAALYATPIPLYARQDRPGDNGLPAIAFGDPWPWTETVEGSRGGLHSVPSGDRRAELGRRQRLVVAGALILAEIERLDRAKEAPAS